MAETTPDTRRSIVCLILVPSLITLAVTILRLVGELQQWSPVFFNRAAGGGAAIVGISWLPFLLGPYFALKLSAAGDRPKSTWKALVLVLLGVANGMGGGMLAYGPPITAAKMFLGHVLIMGGVVFAFFAWCALVKTLLAYGYAARIPVAIVMFFAIRGSWGTHYDAAPGYPAAAGFGRKYLELAILPQLIFWVAFTILIGALFGVTVTAIVRRRRPAGQASS